MNVSSKHLTGTDYILRVCREYGVIDVGPDEVMRTDGTLRIRDDVIDKYVKVDFKNGAIRVTAKGVSGVFPLTDKIAVQVKPRFPLKNLTHMVSVCGYEPTALEALRAYRAVDYWDSWMLDVMTDGFLVAVEEIAERGMLRTYHRRAEGSSYPHGRIETAVTIHRFASRGVMHKVQYSWFEKSVDNAPNRCLRAAALRLYAQHRTAPPKKGSRIRISRLGNALRLLEGVSDDQFSKFMYDPLVRGAAMLPEARSYYRSALDLAIAIVNGHGFELDARDGSLSVGSLLIRTEDLFEDFVRISLQRELADHADINVVDGNTEGKVSLFEKIDSSSLAGPLPTHVHAAGKTRAATPDIVFRNELRGTVPLIADAKFTPVTEHADRDELEQVVTYGARYRSPVVMTIHPRRHNAIGGLVESGRVGDIIVAQYRVDLAADDLDAEMEAMAQSVAGLIAATSPST